MNDEKTMRVSFNGQRSVTLKVPLSDDEITITISKAQALSLARAIIMRYGVASVA